MKKVLIILSVAISCCIGFTLGRYNVFISADNHICIMNYKTGYLAEKAIAGASLELNHLWYSNNDNDYWYDVVVKTSEYQKLDSALNGDWEDFYHYETDLMWESITYKPGYSY